MGRLWRGICVAVVAGMFSIGLMSRANASDQHPTCFDFCQIEENACEQSSKHTVAQCMVMRQECEAKCRRQQ